MQSNNNNNSDNIYVHLKNLPRSEQLKYTSKLVSVLRNTKKNEIKWELVQSIRREFGLDPKNKDALRRGILLNELVDADCLLDPSLYIQNGVTNYSNADIDSFETTPVGTVRKEFKFDNKIGDYTQTSEAIFPMTLEESVSPNDILQLHGYNSEEFTLIKCRTSVWQQGRKTKNKNGEIEVKDLYSSKIEVIPKNKEDKKIDYAKVFQDILNDKDFEEKVNQEAKNIAKEYLNYKYDSNCLVVYMPDLHFGRSSSKEDTGEEWNLDLALKQAKNTINTILKKVLKKDIEQIVYVINSDGLNSEYTKYTTSGRNLQDNSNSPTEIYKQVSEFYIWAIEMFASLAPVKVYNLLGNHSQSYEYTLGLLLQAYFHNDVRVNFDVDAQPRKYCIYGQNLICFAHGDKEGNRLKDIIPNEFSNAWGCTRNHFLFTAHVHHMLWEECANGLEIITLNSATLNDKYTNDKGYRSKNRTMALLFSKEGLEESFFVNN